MTENKTTGELHELDNSDAVKVPKVRLLKVKVVLF